jgi:hypothetical protein
VIIRVKPNADISSLSGAYRILYDYFGEKVDEAEWRLERFSGPVNELIQIDAVGKIPAVQVEPVSILRKAA